MAHKTLLPILKIMKWLSRLTQDLNIVTLMAQHSSNLMVVPKRKDGTRRAVNSEIIPKLIKLRVIIIARLSMETSSRSRIITRCYLAAVQA